MGEVVELSDFRRRASAEPLDGYFLHVEPPAMVVRHFRNGVCIGEERLISEIMLRELLDHMP